MNSIPSPRFSKVPSTTAAMQRYGAAFTPCLYVDLLEGTQEELRALGYRGAFPKAAGFTKPAFPGTASSDTIRLRPMTDVFVWEHALRGPAADERKAYFDAIAPQDDDHSFAGWFVNTRRQACADAVARIIAQTNDAHAAELAALVLAALTEPDFDIARLRVAEVH